MDEFEAYAPPAAETGASAHDKPIDTESLPEALATAIQRLNEHLANDENVRADEKASGGWLRKGTRQFIFVGLGMVLLIPPLLSAAAKRPKDTYWPVLIVFGVVIGAVILAAVLSDLFSPIPARASSPTDALKNYFHAIRNTRYGRAWSMLCPTAREQPVQTPQLGKLPTIPMTRILATPQDFETLFQAFLSPTIGNSFRDKGVTLLREKNQVATVDVFGVFYNYRLWPVGLAFFTAFISWKIVPFAVLAILFFARRRHEVMFRKTLIQGSNGFWYLYSAQFMERPGEVPEVQDSTEPEKQ